MSGVSATEITWTFLKQHDNTISISKSKMALWIAGGLTLLVIGILANQQFEGLDTQIGSEGQWGMIAGGALVCALYCIGYYKYTHKTLIEKREVVIGQYPPPITEDDFHNVWDFMKKANADIIFFSKLPKNYQNTKTHGGYDFHEGPFATKNNSCELIWKPRVGGDNVCEVILHTATDPNWVANNNMKGRYSAPLTYTNERLFAYIPKKINHTEIFNAEKVTFNVEDNSNNVAYLTRIDNITYKDIKPHPTANRYKVEIYSKPCFLIEKLIG